MDSRRTTWGTTKLPFFRVVKVGNNKITETRVEPSDWYDGGLRISVSYKQQYNGLTSNDGNVSVNIAQVLNGHWSAYDNICVKFWMPKDTSYIVHNGELLSVIDKGDGTNICSVKSSIAKETVLKNPIKKNISIGAASIPNNAIIYYSDKDMTTELPVYVVDGSLLSRIYAKAGRTYFSIFTTDGANLPSYKLDQQGDLDIQSGVLEKMDATGLFYRGYYDVQQNNGKEYKDGDANMYILSGGKISAPAIGNIFYIKTIIPEPYFKYCTFTPDNPNIFPSPFGVSLSGESRNLMTIDYDWHYDKGVQVYCKELPYGDWQLKYTHQGTVNYFGWKDTTVVSGTTYRYRLNQKDALGGYGPYTDEYEVTAGSAGISLGATNITNTSAVIMWTTDVPTTSQVEYAVYAGGGYTNFTYTDVSRWSNVNMTAENSSLVTIHSMILTGLNPSTVYGYRVISKTAGGGVNTSGGIKYPTKSFTTAANSAPIISLQGVSNYPKVLPGDVTAINIYGIDGVGIRSTAFSFGTTLNYAVVSGGGSVDPPATVNAYSTVLTTGTVAGINTVRAIKTTGTPLTCTANVWGAVPDHYNISTTSLTVKAGELFNLTITAYSNAAETVILPITTTNLKLSLTPVMGNNSGDATGVLSNPIGNLNAGIGAVITSYAIVEATGIRIKVEDVKGTTGLSDIITVIADSSKPLKVAGSLSKEQATSGETVTITGKILDIYGNQITTSGTAITFAKTQGTGTLSGTAVTTDANGEAKVNLTLNDNSPNVVELTSGSLQKGTIYVRINAVSSVTVTPLITSVKTGGGTEVDVLVKDGSDVAVAGTTVTVSILSGTGSLSANKAVTDITGIARVSYSASTTAGTGCTIKAETGGISNTANINTVYGDIDHYKVESSVTTSLVNTDFMLTVSAMDRYENLVANASNAADLIPTLAGYEQSVALGTLSVTSVSLTGGTKTITNQRYSKTESIKIKASDSGNKYGFSGAISVTSSSVATIGDISIRFMGTSAAKICTGNQVIVAASVKDSLGNPVSGAVITCSADKGAFGNSAVTSDATGRITNTFTAASGTCTVTLRSAGISCQSTIEGVVPASRYIAEGNSISIDKNSTYCEANIIIKDNIGSGVPYAPVSYSQINGSTVTLISPASPLNVDNDGKVMLRCDFSGAGTNTVRITCSGLPYYDLTVSKVGDSLNFSCDYASGAVNANVILKAQVLNSSGANVSGAVVTFKMLTTGTLSVTTATTDASGYAYTTLTLGPSEGGNIVQAEYLGIKKTVTIKGVVPGSIIMLAENNTIAVNGSTNIYATVYNVKGDGIIGFPVSFSIQGGGSGSLSTLTSAADSQGKAVVVYSAGSIAGNVSVQAAAGGVTKAVTINIINLSDLQVTSAPGKVLISSGASVIKAIAKDINNAPLSGANISFSVTGSGSFLTAGAPLTSITVKSDSTGTSLSTFANTAVAGNSTININSGVVTKTVTVTIVSAVSKLRLVAPATLPLYPATNLGIYVQVLDDVGDDVGVSRDASTDETKYIILTSTGGVFKYATSNTGVIYWRTASQLYFKNTLNTGRTKELVDSSNQNISTSYGVYNLGFYPVAGVNTITATSSDNLTSDTKQIIGVDSGFNNNSAVMLKITAEPSVVKSLSNCTIIAKVNAITGMPLSSTGVAFSMMSSLGTLYGLTSVITDATGEANCILKSADIMDYDYVVKVTSYGITDTITVPTAKSVLDSFNIEASSNLLINQPFSMKIKACDINGGPVNSTSPINLTISAVSASNVTISGTGSLNISTTIISNNIDSSITLLGVIYNAAENIKIKITGGGKTSYSDAILFTKPANNISMILSPATCVAGQAVMIDGTIKDIDAKGVSGQTITIASSGGTLDKTSCISDVDGKFSALLVTPSSAGSTTITAVSGSIVGATAITTTSVIASYTVTAPAVADINGFTITITAKDSGNSIVRSSPVVALTTNGTGTLGITSVRLTDGVLVFSETYSKVEGPVKITAKDGNSKSGVTGNITMANSMPIVLTVAPSSASNLQANTITITGLNFYAGTSSSSVTAIKLGTATNLSGWNCISDSVINSAVVPLKTKAGTYDVIVYTPQGSNSTSTGKLTLTTTAPVITTITPNTAVYNQSVTMTITGSGFYAGTNSSDVRGLKVGSTAITTAYNVASDTSITGVIIPNTLTSGTYNVVATTGGGDSAGVPYIVTAPLPVVSAVTPNNGNNNANNTIKIVGNGFFGGVGSNRVTMIQLTGTSTLTITNAYSVISDTEIQNSIIPSGFAGGTYDVKVTTGAGVSVTSANSKYTLVGITTPVISSLNPNNCYYGQSATITITGNSFYGGKSSSDVTAVKIYTSPTTTTIAGYSVLSDTTISSVVIPNTINAGTYQMKVTSSLGEGNGVNFVVNSAVPVVSNVLPNSGYRHLANTIDIYGSGFFGGVGSNKVTMIQMTGASTVTLATTYSVINDTEIQNAVINSGITAGTYDLRVTTSVGTNTTSGVKYIALADTILPTVIATIADTTSVNITFSEEISLSTATIKGNYKVASPAGGAAKDLTSAALTYANNVATITGITNVLGNTFAITVTGVQDIAGNAIAGSNIVSGTVTGTDSTAPSSCTVTINSGVNYTKSTTVTLSLSATDSESGMGQMQFSNGGAYLTPVAYATTTVWALSNGDGAKTVSAKFSDNAGNWSSAVTDTITLDTTAPAGSVSINSGAAYTNGTIVTVTLTAADGAGSGMGAGAQMQFSNDNSNWSTAENYTGTKVLTVSGGDGVKTVYVKYKDAIGNWSGNITDTIILDGNAPTGTVSINFGAQYANSSTVTLTLNAVDAGSGMGAGAQMQFSNDNSTWSSAENYAATKVWTLTSGNGVNTVYAKFKDVSGYWSNAATDTITLDTTGPTNCSIVINNEDVYTSNTSVLLTLSAADTDSGVSEMQFSNNGGTTWSTAVTYNTSNSYTLPFGDGLKTVSVRYKDNAGNWSGSIEGTITLDTTVPTGSIDINGGAAYSRSTAITLSVSADDNLSGVNQMQFREGTGSWSAFESYALGTKVFTVSNADGLKTISVNYTDNAGNNSTYSKNIKLCTVTKLEVLSQMEAVAGESIAVTIRAVREEGVNSTLVTGYLNKIGFNIKDANAASLPDYTFAAGDSGVKQVIISLKTLSEQEIEVTDKDIEGITGKVKIKVYGAVTADGTNGAIITNADGTSVEIPAKAFSGSKQIGFRVTNNPTSAGTGYRYKETVKPVSRDFGELNRTTTPWQLAGMTFSIPVKISVPYKPEEVGDVDENSLRLFYYDESAGKYIIVPGKQTVSGGRITAQVNHFSTYRILGTYVSSNLNNVIAYPNPYKPSTAVDGKLKIINLPVDCTVTIYNIAGEKIREIKEADLGNLGWIEWDGKNESSELVARGVYLYVVIAPDGSKKIGKIGLLK